MLFSPIHGDHYFVSECLSIRYCLYLVFVRVRGCVSARNGVIFFPVRVAEVGGESQAGNVTVTSTSPVRPVFGVRFLVSCVVFGC